MPATLIDVHGIDRFLCEAATRYDKTAPTVTAFVEDLYLRFTQEPDKVTLAELLGVLQLHLDGEWLHPNYAANTIYHLAHRLGRDVTGHAGF